MTTQIVKTVQPSKDVYIQFTEDELIQLNISQGDKFTVKPCEDGFLLEKRIPLEIDLDEWDVEVLRNIVGESLQRDLPVNDIIVEALEKYVHEELENNS